MDITKICEELINKYPDYSYVNTFRRHLQDLDNLPKDQYRFNIKKAELYIIIIQSFQHSTGPLARTPFLLEDWQKALVSILTSWEVKDKKTGNWTRRFRTALIYTSRKSGKTILSAAIMMADSIIRKQIGSQLCCISTKSDQSLILMNEAHGFIKNHPDFKKYYRRVGNKVFSKLDDGRMYSLGRDSAEDGLNISILTVDEMHLFKSDDLLEVCRTSMIAREQPLILITSTAGFDLGSPLVKELEYARSIMSGQIEDDTYFPFLAEPNPNEKVQFTLDYLKRANPNTGISVSEEYLLKEMSKCVDRPDKRNGFITKHLNLYTNSAVDFIDINDWKDCSVKEDEEPFNINDYAYCFIGADYSVNDDLTSITTTYVKDNFDIYVKSKSFLPQKTITENGKLWRAPLDAWVETKDLVSTPGNTVDLEIVSLYIAEIIEEAQELDTRLYYDAFRAKTINAVLENKYGFTDTYSVNQGFLTQTAPTALFSNYVKSGKLKHENIAILNWAVSNTTVLTDTYGNIKVSKGDRFRKIDPVAALINTFIGLIDILEEDQTEDEVIFI